MMGICERLSAKSVDHVDDGPVFPLSHVDHVDDGHGISERLSNKSGRSCR